MAKNKDDLEKEARELEEELDGQDLTEDEARALEADADGGPGDLRSRAARAAIARVEKGKDSPEAMSDAIAQKYLRTGKDLLGDQGSQALDKGLRRRVEGILGRDPGDVRVHTGEQAHAAADALGARAFALGDNDIYFARDQFAPHTSEGLGVLVHELTHVADAQVGAAFSTQDSRAAYSRAEDRAEQSEARAMRVSKDPDNPQRAQSEKIDLQILEDKVAALIERDQRLSSDRMGISGGSR